MASHKQRRKAGRPPAGVNGQRVRDYPQVSIRVPPKLHAQVSNLTRTTGLSRLELFTEAIDCLVRQNTSKGRRRRPRRRAPEPRRPAA